MSDWTDTLDARQAGTQEGFLAADLPLEDQDLAEGGPLVEDVVEEKPPSPYLGRGHSRVDPAVIAELSELTKAELVARGRDLGLALDERATKAELVAAIESA